MPTSRLPLRLGLGDLQGLRQFGRIAEDRGGATCRTKIRLHLESAATAPMRAKTLSGYRCKADSSASSSHARYGSMQPHGNAKVIGQLFAPSAEGHVLQA